MALRSERIDPLLAVDEDLTRGQDPLEDVGPEGCQPSPSLCAEPPGARSGGPEVCRFNVEEHLQDALEIQPTVIAIDPEDGLPVPLDRNDPAEVPVQTIDNYVCMADERTYVEIFADEYGTSEIMPPEMRQGGLSTVSTERVHVSALGREQKIYLVTRERYDEAGSELERLSWETGAERRLFGQTYVELDIGEKFLLGLFRRILMQTRTTTIKRHQEAPETLTDEETREAFAAFVRDGGRVLMPVRPRRRKCVHYKSSRFGVSESPGRKILYPWCTAIRSVGGAFMSIAGEAIYACEHREPPDPESTEKYITGPEREKIKHPPTRLPLFDRFVKTEDEKKRDAEAAAKKVLGSSGSSL